MPKTDNTPLPHRFEEVLLCTPEGEKPVGIIRTIKWMETVLVAKKDEQGQETYEPTGFLVTVPPRNALRVYSHICRNATTHAQAVASLEKDKPEKDRTAGSLPAVWNGAYAGCPLCTLITNEESK